MQSNQSQSSDDYSHVPANARPPMSRTIGGVSSISPVNPFLSKNSSEVKLPLQFKTYVAPADTNYAEGKVSTSTSLFNRTSESNTSFFKPYVAGSNVINSALADMIDRNFKKSEMIKVLECLEFINLVKESNPELYKMALQCPTGSAEILKNYCTTAKITPTFSLAFDALKKSGGDNIKLVNGYVRVSFVCGQEVYYLFINPREKFGAKISQKEDIGPVPAYNERRSRFSVVMSSIIKATQKSRSSPVVCSHNANGKEVRITLGPIAHSILKRFEGVLGFQEYKDIINELLVIMEIEPYEVSTKNMFINDSGKRDGDVAMQFLQDVASCLINKRTESVELYNLVNWACHHLPMTKDAPFILEFSRSMRKNTILNDYFFKDSSLLTKEVENDKARTPTGRYYKAQEVSLKHVEIANVLIKHLNERGVKKDVPIHYYGFGLKKNNKSYDRNFGVWTFLELMTKAGYTNINFYNNRGPAECILGNDKINVTIADLKKLVPNAGEVYVSDVMFEATGGRTKYEETNEWHMSLMMYCLQVDAIMICKMCSNSLPIAPEFLVSGRAHNGEKFCATWTMFVKEGFIHGCTQRALPDTFFTDKEASCLDVSYFARNKFAHIERESTFIIRRDAELRNETPAVTVLGVNVGIKAKDLIAAYEMSGFKDNFYAEGHMFSAESNKHILDVKPKENKLAFKLQ